ncbi:MAG: TPM domain-containing protein, partial [Polaromonas sp.]
MPQARAAFAQIALFFIAVCGFTLPAAAQGLQPVPALTAHVLDATGTLQAAQKQALEDRLTAFEQAKGAQVV